MNNEFREHVSHLMAPSFPSSYEADDCIFMLKDISNQIEEEGNEEREDKMDGGTHYSEMLPIESYPDSAYLNLFYESLRESAPQLAQYIADVSRNIVSDKGSRVVIVSLARAGTPIGVLIKRYLRYAYDLDVPHYSVSIIRGKGIDTNAILYISNKYPQHRIQFVDGWTGKGTINRVLDESIKLLNKRYGLSISSDLAVLADPAHAAYIFGTRDDYFLPSSCLNSIVSGLASRTVHREDLIGEYDYHGAKYYARYEDKDMSRHFVDTVAKFFNETKQRHLYYGGITNQGWNEVEQVKEHFQMNSMNKIKPGIGETTRVLLRRVPWKVIVRDLGIPELKHILMLASAKNVPVEVYPNMSYNCMGLIKE